MAGITFSEVSGVADSVFGKSQAPIRMFIEKRAEQYESESIVKQIFNTENSTHWAERATSMTAMDGFQPVGENGAYPVDNWEEGYSQTFIHETWKDSFSISQEMVEDAVLMNLRKQPAAFVAGYYRTREKYGACLLGNAIRGNASAAFGGRSYNAKGADGQNLFYTSHPSKVSGGTQSNCFADAFSAAALGAVETEMQNFRGDNNEILDVAPDTIIIPNLYALKNEVFAAVGADKDPDTANNAFNYQYGRWNIIVWPYLNQYITSGTAPWVLMDSRYNGENGSLMWYDRVKLAIRSSIDDNTDANVWRGRARFVAGFNDWRAIAVGGVSGGTQLITG